MAQLINIFIKKEKFNLLYEASHAVLLKNKGIEGNYNQNGKRQVTFLDIDAWSIATKELDMVIHPIQRRANFLIKGIDLYKTKGKIIEIGQVQFLIHGETKPCQRMNDVYPGLMQALMPNWAGGCYGEVLTSGTVQIGDQVVLK